MFDSSDLVLQVSSSRIPAPKTILGVTLGFALTDSARTILQANPAFCAYLGYRPQELVGMTVDQLTHPDDLDRTEQAFHILQSRREQTYAYEKRYLHKDGSTVWSLTIVNRLAAGSPDEPPLYIGFLQDISAQKRVEEKLRATKGLYQDLVENIGVGLSLIDKDHRILMVNSKLAQVFEKAPADFVGRHCFGEFERRTDVCPHCPGVQAMASGQPQTVITEGVIPGGRRVRVRIKAFPVFDGEGGCTGFVELIEDLSTLLGMETALQESEERFKVLAEAAPIGIFEVSAEGLNTYSNPAWVQMTGLSMEESLGTGWAAAIPAEDRQGVEGSWQETKRQEVPWRKEHRLLHRNGEMRWVQAAAVPVHNSKGELLRYVGTIVDLTARKQAMEKLAASEERFRSIYEKSAVGMKLVARDGCILDANPAFCSFVGRSMDELKSARVQSLFHPEDLAETDQVLDSFCGHGPGETFERRYLHKDGTIVWGEVTGVWIPGGAEVEGFGVCLVQDITRKKEAQARLEYLAYHDEQTGLPNQRLLKDRLAHAIAKSKRSYAQVGVLLIGLDRFSKIIGTFDHETGNLVLCEIANRLKEVVRQADTLARFGDTEFVILLEDVGKLKTTRVVAQNILQKIAEPITVQGHSFLITASLGIGLFPDDGGDAEQLLRSASAAMNRAKQQGGDLLEYFIPELNVRTRELLSLGAELRQALNNEEFLLHFQPQVALQTREVVGFEALVRWQHPERGLVPPADFIPLAEETGVIVPLGEWILRRACLQNMAWQRAGLALKRMAVNISPRQFRRVDLPGLVRRVLEETGHPPEFLELEITESMVMDDVDRAIEVMKEIAGMGVHLAIDDFGSGYSSLHYLKRFPVERLKVDRSFVKDVMTDANDAAIASAVVALAKTMNLDVVAEGIETEEQLAFFLARGCSFGQGYLFSKPLVARQAGEFLACQGSRGAGLQGQAAWV
jgi:diguanylate cyclase (GGDEF)-like protein/PAS domain S-box-containing protein